ncbi:MAG: prolyl oligopeptidase family serine peptidase [Saprospiraceae bacterium]|nr:prolyl oligopeptidase family serine peptidase [Saprospiraceae bacterium]MDZ4705889.1 prolyl oligopeptidase family serine peptidase [Saprospiraceae bacterium]
MRAFTLTTLFLAAMLPLIAQKPANRSALKIEQFMQGERFTGFAPQDISWSEDSKTIYFSWNPDLDTLRSRYSVGIEGGQPQKLTPEVLRDLPEGGVYNKSFSQKLYGKNGDLFLLDLANGQKRQITNTVDRESNARFSGDEKHVIFQQGNNLYVWEIAGGALQQLTDFRRGAAKLESPLPEQEQWLKNDQLEWFEVLAERKATRETRERRDKALDPKRPREIYYGERQQLSNVQISPDLKYVTYRLSTPSRGKSTKVPDFVTESGYIEDLNARQKVGTAGDTYESSVYDIERDTHYVLDIKQIEGIYEKPAYLAEYHKDTTAYNPKYKNPREVLISGPVFSEDGKAVVVVRALDNKDRWIMLLDPATGKLKLLDRQHDDAWVGGPGVGSNFSTGNIGWMPDNKRIWFHSEATGFSHLYALDAETLEKKALTSGNFEILNTDLSKDNQWFYITANAEGPHEQHFYRLPLNGGKLEKITAQTGAHEVELSPDEKLLAVRHSYSNQPWELYIMENKPGATMRQLTKSTTAKFDGYKWRDPEIVWFTARDGVKVPARLYRPAKAKKGGPAVIFVHGAGYLQNVHKWWSTYHREFMFHNYLADNGYTVLDIDYRASSGYGRDWRTAIYRFMGGKDLDDHIDGARYLTKELGVDAKRIGIYGGSYGGFITLMGLFTSPGTFKSGAALRSVTDWAHYNHSYTANILNTPALDSIAYARSSPIYHAKGLKDQLLILHGMVDTNVQFQDVVRLSQRLIELGKDGWEFAVYPMEDHGFVEPSSWADEYKRIYKLFEETLK